MIERERSEQMDTLNSRYIKLAVLVVVAGSIYPLLYLRQNFEVSLIDALDITSQQLAKNYSILGFLYLITYLPSGWLADKVSPRILMSFSLLTTGLLGAWFATLPSFLATQIIFAGWGITAGLTFWAALIKATTLLAKPNEQGRFFGILESGRGLVEAILATLAIALFAYATNTLKQDTSITMQSVIWMYVIFMLVLAPVSYFALGDDKQKTATVEVSNRSSSLIKDLMIIAKVPQVWLSSICILTGYQLYYATYSFSAYIQNHYGLTAVAVGSITVASQWMRPIGAIAAGFGADFFNRERVLSYLLLANSAAVVALAFMPSGSGVIVLLGTVLFVGLLTYAVRGIYWATIETCDISNHVKGLAIGLISLIGYAPHFYLPLVRGHLITEFPEKTGYVIYFNLIAICGVLGAIAAWKLKRATSSNA